MNILEDELTSLGETETQVADTLRKHKITGEFGNTWACPIVMYLKKVGYANVIVDKAHASAYSMVSVHKSKAAFALKTDLPQAVKDFIKSFDDGLYPEFIKSNDF